MNRSLHGTFSAALGLLVIALVHGCGDSSQEDGGAGDGGTDGSLPDSGGNDAAAGSDANVSADADVDAGLDDTSDAAADGEVEAACVHLGDPDSGIDASSHVDGGGSALVFVDIGGADRPIDLSADGKLALLQDGTAANGDVYLYDTVTGALTRKTITGDPGFTLATSLSGDGNQISAYHGTTSIVAGVWDACGGWTDAVYASGCPGDVDAGNPNTESGAFNLDFDGSIAVGYVWNGCPSVSAMLWTRAGAAWTPTPLQHLGMAGGSNRASYVSADGSVIGGFAEFPSADRVPAIWHSDGTGVVLDPTGMAVGEVLAISADGTMVAGPWNATVNGSFYWTQAEGVVQLGTLPNSQPQDQVWLNAIAASNTVIFGADGDPSWSSGGLGSEEVAVVWTKAKGMRKLQDVVTAQQLTLPTGWDLTDVTAASADGSVVLGYATDTASAQLTTHMFVLRLSAAVY